MRSIQVGGLASLALIVVVADVNANANGAAAYCDDPFTVAERAAGDGDAHAQYCTGLAYRDGRGVQAHRLSALRWLQQAANGGHVRAQLELGLLLLKQERLEAGAKWLARAADGGNGAALNALGELHYEGRGVPRDQARAVELFRKAADRGNALGRLNLGMALIAKRETFDAGLDHIAHAAASGDSRAMYELGELMVAARSNARLHSSGARMILNAARQGYVRAQLRAADLYETTLADRPAAKSEAERWYREATKSEDKRLADYAYAQLSRLSLAERRLERDYTRPTGRSPLAEALPADSVFGMFLRAYDAVNFMDSGKSFAEALADTADVLEEHEQAQLEKNGVAYKRDSDEHNLRFCHASRSVAASARVAILRDYWAKMISHPGLDEVPYAARGWAHIAPGECKGVWANKVTYYRIEYLIDDMWVPQNPLAGEHAELLSDDEYDALVRQERVASGGRVKPILFCGSRSRDFKFEAPLSDLDGCRESTGTLPFEKVAIVSKGTLTVNIAVCATGDAICMQSK